MFWINSTPITSVVIAGTGGCGLEVLDYVNSVAQNGGPPIAGFIDDNQRPSHFFTEIQSNYLGTIDNFTPNPGQIVIVAIGSKVKARREVLERLWAKGISTPAFIAPNVILSPSAIVERASIVCSFSIINRNATLGAGVIVNVHCSVAHGAKVGAYSILSPYAALNGDAEIGHSCFLGTRATIYPRIKIGDECVVTSHTGVRKNAADRKKNRQLWRLSST
ncbi:hypothetical protein TI04_03950 [Achromatium sp. WMS2]|nr:hypothetical protein TI04_03950 [Achromatium sp. WMS2]